MFLNHKTPLAAFAFLAVTGCVNTADIAQQKKMANLESTLSASKKIITETQSELDNTTIELQKNEKTITALTLALAESQKATASANAKNQALTKKVSPPKSTHLNDKTVLGQNEWVYVSKVKENFKARIDTGAATSSINAVDIERFERDGKKWVRFNLTHAEGEHADIIEAKIIRIIKIRQSNNTGEAIERPVVELHIRLGDIAQLTEFTLTNRSHMDYPVLIGRTFMRDLILVDVGTKYNFSPYQPTNNHKD